MQQNDIQSELSISIRTNKQLRRDSRSTERTGVPRSEAAGARVGGHVRRPKDRVLQVSGDRHGDRVQRAASQMYNQTNRVELRRHE